MLNFKRANRTERNWNQKHRLSTLLHPKKNGGQTPQDSSSPQRKKNAEIRPKPPKYRRRTCIHRTRPEKFQYAVLHRQHPYTRTRTERNEGKREMSRFSSANSATKALLLNNKCFVLMEESLFEKLTLAKQIFDIFICEKRVSFRYVQNQCHFSQKNGVLPNWVVGFLPEKVTFLKTNMAFFDNTNNDKPWKSFRICE